MKRIVLFSILVLLLLSCKHEQQSSLKFVFLTDLHVNPDSSSEEALKNIVAETNSDKSLSFVIVTGDISNTGSDAELNAVKNALDQLTIPYYIITGNHETNWSESAGATFIKLWGNDRFFFEHGNYMFIGFSTGPYMKMGDGHAKEEDIYWLDQELCSKNVSGKTLIVAAHYPLKDGLDNWHKVTEVLKKHNARFVMCGHEHRLSLHNFDGIAGVMGRATVKKESEIAGYNIIELKNDSVYVFEKELGIDVLQPAFKFSLKNNEDIKDLPTPTLPDFSVNNEYDVNVETIIQDTASIFTGVAIHKNVLVYGNSKGEVVAWDTQANQLLWKKQFFGSIYSTPSLYNELAFIGTIDGNLQALNINDGTVVWSLNLEKPIISEGIIEGNTLYIGAGNDFYKISAEKGEIIWKNKDINGQLQGKPAIFENNIVFGAWDTHLYCLNKNSGDTIWTWTNGHPGVLFSPANVVPAISNGKVFIVAPDRYMTAINLQNGKTIWRTNQHKVRESMGMSNDGKLVYAKLMNDSIIAVSTAGNQYKEEWIIDAGFGYEHNPCPIVEFKNIIYAGGKNGLLVAIDKNTHQIIWKHKCGNSSINKITPDSNNGVWISLIEGKILHIIN